VAATSAELAAVPEGVATLVCGVGPVEAAAATAAALAERRPDAVLHVGVAGGRGLHVGTLVLGTKAVYHDLAAAVPVVASVEPDTTLLAEAGAALPGALLLPIGTSAGVGRSAADAQVEAMEGFAVLRAAQLAGIPAVELRAIGNEVDEPDRAKWRLGEALAALEDAVPRVLAALRS
jgi:futalosine hydrolase